MGIEDKYERLTLIDRGGMGEVWRMKRRSDAKEFAVKSIRLERLEDSNFQARFEREMKVLTTVNHPHLVSVEELIVGEREQFIVMELARCDLTKMINDPHATDEQLSDVFVGLCRGLAYLHEAGLVHRDLKPGNVLVYGDSTAKISDFGLAFWGDRSMSTLTASGTTVGTPFYAAPEQMENGKHVDSSADMWALGLIAYEILLRKSPNFSRSIQGTARIHELVRICLRDEPDERNVTCEEMAGAFCQYFGLELKDEPLPRETQQAVTFGNLIAAIRYIQSDKQNESAMHYLFRKRGEELDTSGGPIKSYLRELFKAQADVLKLAEEISKKETPDD